MVAGSGADAAPYFRIFNPILQGEKFDKNGEYVKKWVPELENLPKNFCTNSWELKMKELLNLEEITLIQLLYMKELDQKALNAFQKI